MPLTKAIATPRHFYPVASHHESRGDFSDLNLDSLRSMVKYIASLKDHGTIDEDTFSDLIARTCSIFVENEVEQRVSKVLGESLGIDLLHSSTFYG